MVQGRWRRKDFRKVFKKVRTQADNSHLFRHLPQKYEVDHSKDVYKDRKGNNKIGLID